MISLSQTTMPAAAGRLAYPRSAVLTSMQRIVERRATLILGTALLSLLAALAVASLSTPHYQSSVSISYGHLSGAETAGGGWAEPQRLDLLSDDILRQAVSSQRLVSDIEFAPADVKADGAQSPSSIPAQQAAVENLKAAVAAGIDPANRVVTLTLSTRNAGKSARILNAIAHTYVSRFAGLPASSKKSPGSAHTGKLARLQIQMQKSQEAVQQFAIQNNLPVDGSEIRNRAATGGAFDIVLAKAKVLEARFEHEQLRRALSSSHLSGSLPRSLAPKSGAELRSILAQREQALHNAVQLVASLENPAAGRNASSKPAAATFGKQRQLKAEFEKHKGAYEALVATRSASTSQALAASRKPEIVSLAVPAEGPVGMTVSTSATMSLAGGLALGLLLAFGLEGVQNRTWHKRPAEQNTQDKVMPVPPRNTTVAQTAAHSAQAQVQAQAMTQAQPKPAQQAFSRPHQHPVTLSKILARISGIGNGIESMSFVLDAPQSAESKAVGAILDALQVETPSPGAQTLLVTAPAGIKKNKSAIALNLAFSAGLRGQRVLVVDADLSERLLSRIFVGRAPFGIVEVVGGISEIDDVIVRDPNMPVSFLPCAPLRSGVVPNLPEAQMAKLLGDLSNDYDLVVLDAGRVGAEPYVAKLGRCSDNIILVTDSAAANSKGYAAAIQAVAPLDAKFAGIIALPDSISSG